MTNKKKTIFIILISIVTIISILYGLYIHVFSKWNLGENFNRVTDTIDFNENLDSINIDLDACELEIYYGNKFSISYDTLSSLSPEITCQNKTLEIKSLAKNNLDLLTTNVLKSNKIRLTLPKNAKLISGKINSDLGNITINDLEIKDFNIKLDAGNVTLHNVKAEKLKASVDAGNLTLLKNTIDDIDASVDAGNISASTCTLKSGTCKTDLGNITLSGDIGNVQPSSSLGNVSIDNNGITEKE